MNLYKFNTKSWHVILFTFLWSYNPTYYYKTMCPYFWKSILGVIISPFLIFSKGIRRLTEKWDRWKVKRAQENEKDAILTISTMIDKDFSSDTAIQFIIDTGMRRWQIYCAALDKRYPSDDLTKLKNDYWDYRGAASHRQFIIINEIRDAKRKNRMDKRQKFTDIISKIMSNRIVSKISAVLVSLSLLIIVGGVLSLIIIWGVNNTMDFWKLFKGLGILFVAVGSIVGGYYIVKILVEYIETLPAADRPGFLSKVGDWFLKVFQSIGNGFVIIFDMIVNLYRQSCPLITWVNDEKK